ncbi:MAG: hypothetical protein ACFE9D_09230 [Promethearchaeota archaeon]
MDNPTEKELEKQGWEKRFSVEKHRAAEYKANYEELGFEVLILPTAEVETDRTCDKCIEADDCTLVTIFTRPK